MQEHRLDPNKLFILLAMQENANPLLDLYDKNNTNKKVMIFDYQDLLIHGLIESSDSNKLYQLSERGKEVVELIKPLFQVDAETKESEARLKQLCQDYLLVFPKIKLPSGKYARVSSVEIEKKLKAWMRTYRPMFKKEHNLKITEEIILNATKAYVTRYAKDNYRFMVTSSYFIQKNEKSALADEILALKQGIVEETPKTNITVV